MSERMRKSVDKDKVQEIFDNLEKNNYWCRPCQKWFAIGNYHFEHNPEQEGENERGCPKDL